MLIQTFSVHKMHLFSFGVWTMDMGGSKPCFKEKSESEHLEIQNVLLLTCVHVGENFPLLNFQIIN